MFLCCQCNKNKCRAKQCGYVFNVFPQLVLGQTYTTEVQNIRP